MIPPKPRPAPRPNYRRLPERKTVTIAAGIMCSDGIVICSDTEHTDYVAKYQREKIFRFENRLTVSGAGNSDFIQMAFNKLCDECRSAQPVNPSDAREIVEKLVLDIHSSHIFKFYQPTDQQRPSLDLIVATRCSNGELALVKTADTAAVLAQFYEAVGGGRPLFNYWANFLYRPGVTVDLMSYLCIFILREVKLNVDSCGGLSFIAAMMKDASLEAQLVWSPEDTVLAGFPNTVAPLLRNCRDLRVDEKEFQDSIESFAAGLRAIRQMEWTQHNAKKMMKEHLPLPDGPLGVPDPFGNKAEIKLSDERKSED